MPRYVAWLMPNARLEERISVQNSAPHREEAAKPQFSFQRHTIGASEAAPLIAWFFGYLRNPPISISPSTGFLIRAVKTAKG
mgnify:CR=1 FL=1